MVVLRESSCIWEKVVVLGKKGLFSEKSDYNRASVTVFGQSGCIGAKWLYSGKSCCIRPKVVGFVQNCCIRAKVVVIGQSDCNRANVVVFEQK